MPCLHALCSPIRRLRDMRMEGFKQAYLSHLPTGWYTCVRRLRGSATQQETQRGWSKIQAPTKERARTEAPTFMDCRPCGPRAYARLRKGSRYAREHRRTIKRERVLRHREAHASAILELHKTTQQFGAPRLYRAKPGAV